MHYCSLDNFTGTFFMSDSNSASEMKKQKTSLSTL